MADEKDTKESTSPDKSQEKKDTTTILVGEKAGKKKFPTKLVLIYLLLLAVGLFIGIVFRLATR